MNGAVLLALVLGAAASANAQVGRGHVEPLVVKVGYTTFDSPDVVRSTDSTLPTIERYLAWIASAPVAGTSGATSGRRRIQSEIVLGNYYQVWSWFHSGQIDAAIVSPFTAMLLERDAQAVPLVEFSEHCALAGHRPLMAASGPLRDSPELAFQKYIDALVAIASERDDREANAALARLRQTYGVNLVSHLSTSGFIMPALYARWRLGMKKHLDDVTADRFWRLFFQTARFTFEHRSEVARQDLTSIYFSYDGRSAAKLEKARRDNGLGEWRLYTFPPFEADRTTGVLRVPSIPNDVLVVKRHVAEEMVGVEGASRGLLAGQLAAQLAAPEAQGLFEGGEYTRVAWFNPSVHGAFRDEVNALFSRSSERPSLGRLYRRWYERGRFDFTINETLSFLRQDQENSGSARLALVLSGGGVKSLYQSVLLDHLYGLDGRTAGDLSLRNYDEGPQRWRGPLPRSGALTVHSIIGTSGGAMLAYFAAQVPQISGLQKVVQGAAERAVFPPVDLLRWLSGVALLAILYAVLLGLRGAGWWGGDPDAKALRKSCVWWLPGGTVLLLVAGALAIAATQPEDVETVRGLEGSFFVFTALVAHFGLTCIGRRREGSGNGSPALRRLGLVAAFFGFELVVIALLVHGASPETASHLRGSLPGASSSVLAGAGILTIGAAFLTAAAAGCWGLELSGVRDYAAAMLAVVVHIGLCALLFLVLVYGFLGPGSMLELTPLYWLEILAIGLAASALVLVASRIARWAGPVDHGLLILIRDRRGGLTTTMAGTMLAVLAMSVGLWLVVVAPAIYGNGQALEAFMSAQTERERWGNTFRSNLVVTGTLLKDRRCGGEALATVRGGGLYFCFEGAEGCGVTQDGQWRVFRRPAPARAVDAVFASGSAFPVLPPHRAHLPDGCEVSLIDGGYAHNVPLEAAALSEARQVLVINASPDADDPVVTPRRGWNPLVRIGGQLFRNAPELLSFMFSRAQELDRSAGGDLVVASLAPKADARDWPFLLDFRPATRDRMVREATRDIESQRRIGKVLSWGRPVTFQRVRPGAPSGNTGWSSSAAADIRKVLDGPVRAAAFDLDNTCLRGDIGDAFFLKMVVEMRYRGDLEGFWSLIPNLKARKELKHYWRALKNSRAPRSVSTPRSWGREFTDYVVLFHRQYEQILEADGKAVAYPWVVRLMEGMTPEEAGALAEEVWKDEMGRPDQAFSVRSERFGPLEIPGGVRIRVQFQELIAQLRERGFDVWLVTASNVYAGRVAASALGIPIGNVIGITPRVGDDGRLARDMEAPVPYGAGKAQALSRRGIRLALAAGDSASDVPMLLAASTRIVVGRQVKVAEVGAAAHFEDPDAFRVTKAHATEATHSSWPRMPMARAAGAVPWTATCDVIPTIDPGPREGGVQLASSGVRRPFAGSMIPFP